MTPVRARRGRAGGTLVNDLYFRCEDCKRYIDAGRWAYATLVQSGAVSADDFGNGGTDLPVVSVKAVLGAKAYWDAPEGNDALLDRLKIVREFLTVHGQHRLSFGDVHRFHRPPDEWMDWLCLDIEAELSPRYLVEVLGFVTWFEVERHVSRLTRQPWWWSEKNQEATRRHFEVLAERTRPSGKDPDFPR
jgi:hypothetical protein